MNLDKELQQDLVEIFKDHPEALNFSYIYCEYIHKIDDIIDENGNWKDVLKASSLASICFSTPFWLKYGDKLVLIEQLINNQYADSVEWESSEEEWKRTDARCMSHAGYNMLFAIILLLKGYDTLRKISSKWRERAHKIHMEHMCQVSDLSKEEQIKYFGASIKENETVDCKNCTSNVLREHITATGCVYCDLKLKLNENYLQTR